jgi:hypothetical protein
LSNLATLRIIFHRKILPVTKRAKGGDTQPIIDTTFLVQA